MREAASNCVPTHGPWSRHYWLVLLFLSASLTPHRHAKVEAAISTLVATAKRMLPQQRRNALLSAHRAACVAATRAARRTASGACCHAAKCSNACSLIIATFSTFRFAPCLHVVLCDDDVHMHMHVAQTGAAALNMVVVMTAMATWMTMERCWQMSLQKCCAAH